MERDDVPVFYPSLLVVINVFFFGVTGTKDCEGVRLLSRIVYVDAGTYNTPGVFHEWCPP